jgi:hypothetical protein
MILLAKWKKEDYSKICWTVHGNDDERGELGVSVNHMLTLLWNV